MVRTQIQLTEEQSQILKSIALEKGVSVPELIRQSIDHYIQFAHQLAIKERRQRALSLIGIAASGTIDMATNHDYYLVEAYGDYEQ